MPGQGNAPSRLRVTVPTPPGSTARCTEPDAPPDVPMLAVAGLHLVSPAHCGTWGGHCRPLLAGQDSVVSASAGRDWL